MDAYFFSVVILCIFCMLYFVTDDTNAPRGNPFTEIGKAKNRYRAKYKERVAFYINNGSDYYRALVEARDDLRKNGIGS